MTAQIFIKHIRSNLSIYNLVAQIINYVKYCCIQRGDYRVLITKSNGEYQYHSKSSEYVTQSMIEHDVIIAEGLEVII